MNLKELLDYKITYIISIFSILFIIQGGMNMNINMNLRFQADEIQY